MSEAKKIVAEIEPKAVEIRELLVKLLSIKMTDEQDDALILVKQHFYEWLYSDFAELQGKCGLERIKVNTEQESLLTKSGERKCTNEST